jgi:holo-[acyl-carrier protein] synthase
MILGIGTDLANGTNSGTLDRFGDRFRNRVFTDINNARLKP